MPLTSDLFSLVAFNRGQLKMSSKTEQRFRELQPLISEVAGDPFTAALMAGVAWTESDFVPDAINPTSGASGLMQVMPFHFPRLGWAASYLRETRELVGRNDLWKNPRENLEAGLGILRDSGLGEKPLRETLANYGGFITKDPAEYIDRVVTRGVFLFPPIVLA